TYDGAFLRAFREVVVPLIGAFEPDVFVLELGMDGLAGDPLTHLSLTNNAYAEAIAAVRSFGRPILAVGGGGYNVANSVRGFALAWAVLCGEAGAEDDQAAGLGGVLMGTGEWLAGLRDRRLAPPAERRREVDRAVEATIEKLKKLVFPHHGL
ncbi:MAG: hypothetical protein J7M21_00570, partial [Planctomycetes bacterium]|nr:hypothetical protein [Planctomycetota bacterium]